MVCYNGLGHDTSLHLLLAFGAMFLELMALSAVWQTIWLPTDFSRWVHDSVAAGVSTQVLGSVAST